MDIVWRFKFCANHDKNHVVKIVTKWSINWDEKITLHLSVATKKKKNFGKAFQKRLFSSAEFRCLLGFVNTRIQDMLPKWSGDKGIILDLVNTQKPFSLG